MSGLAFYNYNKLFSNNCTYNMVIGGRGLGKTYGAKKKAVKDAIRDGAQHIYLRRFDTEMVAKASYFDDLIANGEFPKWDFRINGNIGEIAPIETRDVKKRQWQIVVHFIPLSKAQNYKSVSFPRVTLIIFDEFIIEKGYSQYLPDEAKVFDNFYSTVDRWQDRTRVLFLANSVSIMNPYFMRYNIVPTENDEWLFYGTSKVKPQGFVCVHLAKSKDFADGALATAFGQFIQDTDYAEYAVGNQFSDNSDNMLAMKTGVARYLYTLQTKRATFSVWWSASTNHYYCQAKLPKQERKYTIMPDRVDSDNLLLLSNDKILQLLRTSFRTARVWFDNPSTRNAFIDIFKR